MTHPTSLLFIPADRADFVAKAAGRGADAIILDLEDAVAPAAKAAARAGLSTQLERLRADGVAAWVRINALAEGGKDDIPAALAAGADMLMLPKCADADTVAEAARLAGPGVGLVPLLEDARAVLGAAAIATAPQVAALAFGSEDMAAGLGVEPSPLAMTLPAQMVVLGAAAAGLPAYGLPGSIAQFRDIAAFEAVARQAAGLGFAGAMCIHPAQVAALNTAFAPSPAQIAWAEDVLKKAEAMENGAGAVDGAMIDRPVIERARRVAARAATGAC